MFFVANLNSTKNLEKTAEPSDELVFVGGLHRGEPAAGFDPINSWGNGYEPLVQSTLFKRNSNGDVITDLATDYSVSPDGLTWTVSIRNDVKFTDGVSLTAEDVAFTFNTAAASSGGPELFMLENAEALDENTIVFTLTKPYSPFINKLIAVGIVPEHSYTENYGQNPIGSGPYKFVQWDKGQQVIFERNEDYYGQKPYFKKLTILFMTEDSSFAASQAGEVDIAEIPFSFTDKSVNGMKLVTLDSIDTMGISFPMQLNSGRTSEENYPIGNNVTCDIAIRTALNTRINRQDIIDGALNGHGQKEILGMGMAKLPWGNTDVTLNDGNIETAKKILANGGWKDTDGDGILEKNGVKAEFTLLYAAANKDRQAGALMISEQAKDIGIQINIKGTNWDEIEQLMLSTPVVFRWGTLDPSEAYFRYYSDPSGSGKVSVYDNVLGYNNSVVDSYMDKALAATDQETANEYWKLAAWDGKTGYSVYGDATYLWVASYNHPYLVADDLDIGTPVIQPHGGDIFGNIYEWKRVN